MVLIYLYLYADWVQGKVISYYSERQGVSIKTVLSEEMVTISSLLLRHMLTTTTTTTRLLPQIFYLKNVGQITFQKYVELITKSTKKDVYFDQDFIRIDRT